MKSRLLGGVAAVVLALIGAVLVFSYAANADARAMADLQPTDVLVVRKAIPAGTAVEKISDSVALEKRPAGSVPSGTLSTLDGLTGTVAAADLVPGEALVGQRLVDPKTLQTPGSIPIPKGLQEVTFALEPQRMIGGTISAGSTVGIFASFDKDALEKHPGEESTQRVFHKVLVTRLQRADPATEPAQGSQALPTGTMLVTVAVNDQAASKIVFTAEFGHIWLTNEPKDAKEDNPPKPVRITEVYP
ncbi:Flp pilus assembly protein CpaB [Arthrobacter sp. JSM 101049]|uniref:Flp pilus assembly protein CpaB n=1 Tax=Arthrobacter sp. JSM 101049 TaxID=929097 RepID=UPI00356A3265